MRKVCSFILLFAFLYACQDEVKPTVDFQIPPGDELPTQESWDSEIYLTEGGILKAVVYSNHIEAYESKQATYLDGVKIDFYNPAGEKSSQLTSKKGRVDDATKNMYAIDSVVAVNDSGTVLKTDELMWENKTQKIKTDKFVTITTDAEIIEGYGFESDQGLEHYTIYDITYSTILNNNK
jgi:LPS export ABC transporter protein LptC